VGGHEAFHRAAPLAHPIAQKKSRITKRVGATLLGVGLTTRYSLPHQFACRVQLAASLHLEDSVTWVGSVLDRLIDLFLHSAVASKGGVRVLVETL
jgi:hypothetical protein